MSRQNAWSTAFPLNPDDDVADTPAHLHLAMSGDPSPDATRYEVYPEGKNDNGSHIVLCSSNRNTVQRLVTAFADGDPLSSHLYPLLLEVNRGRNSSKLAQLSKVAKQYRDQASALKKEDARLQEDIMDMMVRLAQVRSDIVATENRLDLACNSMSPIRLLPSELLEVIFIEVAGAKNKEGWVSPKSSPQTVLSHVCSAWRRIAVELPHLWNRFLFDLGAPLRNNRHPQQNLFYLDLWVKRSNPLPFSICLQTVNHLPHPSDGVYYQKIFQSIADRVSSRIELLRVHGDSPVLWTSATWSQLASVKRLELSASASSNTFGRVALPCPSFEQLPSLTSYYYDVSPASPFLFPVSFTTLTELEVGESNNEGIDIYALRYLLRSCPKLKWGRFFMAPSSVGRGGFIMNGYVSQAATRSINPNDSCSLEDLESLNLNGEYFLLQTIFRKLETPKLRVLELRLRDTIVNDPVMESWKQTFESLSSLRTLSISCGFIEDIDKLQDCFGPLDHLLHLKYQAQCDSRFFQLLKTGRDTSTMPLLPKLRHLSTSVWNMKPKEKQDFWEMLHSRSSHVNQFGSYGDQFMVDAFVDRTKLSSTDVPTQLRNENPSAKCAIRFHIVSPFTRM